MTIKPGHQIDPFAHLSDYSAARKPSPLTALRQYFSRPDIISLGGGYPHASMFPIGKLSFDVCTPGSSEIKQRTVGTGLEGSDFIPSHLNGGKGKVPTSTTSLYPFLQYGPTEGDARLRAFCKDLVQHLHNPPSLSWDLSMCAGGGAAIELIFRLLCGAGDWVLFDEFTYPATLECATAQGLRLKGVAVDEQGMCPKALKEVLASWDEAKDGKRPLVMCECSSPQANKIQAYWKTTADLVPGGQNPLSIFQSAERRKAIYEVACDYHLCIIEDDPYGMLCMGSGQDNDPATVEEYLATIPPSYLSLDPHGRVIRIDSFSKLFFPGARLGYISAHKSFIERITRHAEVSVRQPSGMIQAVALNILDGEESQPGWGVQGWVEWCFELSKKYRARRDVLCGALDNLVASPLGKGRIHYLKPQCGMFLVVNMNLDQHPKFVAGDKTRQQLLHELFERCVDGSDRTDGKGVIVAPGYLFATEEQDKEKANFMRMTFAFASSEQMVTAVERFGYAVDDFWTGRESLSPALD